MVQLSDMSDLAQKSWSISCAVENEWLCNHQCQSSRWLANLHPQDMRNQTWNLMRFDQLDSRRELLCHMAITDKRGQTNTTEPVAYNYRSC